MLQFTCGSSLPLDYSKFDGVVIGYHWQFFKNGLPNSLDFGGRIVRGQFLYGHTHHAPHPLSNCETIDQWVGKRVGRFPQINEWVLANEFTDDLGVPYPDYKLDDLKRYCEAAHLANPNARLILGDFKPYLFKKWGAIAKICHELKAEGFPVEAGLQLHLKTYNASTVLYRLPRVFNMFDCPIHIIEYSLWYKNSMDKIIYKYVPKTIEDVLKKFNVKSFCNWWLCEEDTGIGRKMPTFEGLKLFTPNIELLKS